jgi:hypothetical protein
MHPDQTESSATHFLCSAVSRYARLDIGIRGVFTDNGLCYKANRFRNTCQNLGIQPKRTRPYTRAPTAKPTTLSRQPCANALTPAFIKTQSNAPPRCYPSTTRAALDDNNLLRRHI